MESEKELMELQGQTNYFEFIEEDNLEKRRYLILIIYDIISNRRRARLVKFLNSYASRVQKSAFEGVLTNYKYQKLLSHISKYITEEDFLRVYKLAGNTDVTVWGAIPKTGYEDVIIV